VCVCVRERESVCVCVCKKVHLPIRIDIIFCFVLKYHKETWD